MRPYRRAIVAGPCRGYGGALQLPWWAVAGEGGPNASRSLGAVLQVLLVGGRLSHARQLVGAGRPSGRLASLGGRGGRRRSRQRGRGWHGPDDGQIVAIADAQGATRALSCAEQADQEAAQVAVRRVYRAGWDEPSWGAPTTALGCAGGSWLLRAGGSCAGPWAVAVSPWDAAPAAAWGGSCSPRPAAA